MEDPIEKDKCVICGKETDRKMEQFPQWNKELIPMCGGCEATSTKAEIEKAIKEYLEKRDGEEISRTLAVEMKEKGYEHYLGPSYQGEESRHFIKDGMLVTIIVNHSPDDETIEAIRGE